MALIETAAPLFFHPLAGVTVPPVPWSHRQEILRPEIRGVSDVGSRSDSVRDRSAAAPIHPYVLNARAAALRRSCGNDVA